MQDIVQNLYPRIFCQNNNNFILRICSQIMVFNNTGRNTFLALETVLALSCGTAHQVQSSSPPYVDMDYFTADVRIILDYVKDLAQGGIPVRENHFYSSFEDNEVYVDGLQIGMWGLRHVMINITYNRRSNQPLQLSISAPLNSFTSVRGVTSFAYDNGTWKYNKLEVPELGIDGYCSFSCIQVAQSMLEAAVEHCFLPINIPKLVTYDTK